MKYDVAVVGNGIIGCSIAYLLSKETKLDIALVGSGKRPGSASLAAGAMLNVFGEVDENTLRDPINQSRFELAISATSMWPEWIDELSRETQTHIELKYGTHIFHNSKSLDRDRFNLIVQALKRYKEQFSYVDSIPGFNPKVEAQDIIRIPGEGWVIPSQLFTAFDKYLGKHVDVYENNVLHLTKEKVIVTTNEEIIADKIIICAGAWTRDLLNRLDHNMLRLFYGVGTSLQVVKPSLEPFDQQTVIRTPIRAGACGLITVPHPNALYIGASSWVTEKQEMFPRVESIQHLLNSSVDQINRQLMNTMLVKYHLGMRPVSEDSFPLIGELESNPGFFVVTGTRRDGLHMSPLIARDILSRICSGKNIISDTFKPEREPIKFLTRQEGIRQAYNARMNYAINHNQNVYPDLFSDEVEQKYDDKGLTYGVLPELLDVF